MGRQPYMPLYVGDYIKDTRVLPLNVRGAWVDLILFMWDNPVRGEFIGTIEEVARLIGCGAEEAHFALNLLKQKGTADIDLLTTGEYKIVSRRMKRDAQISKIRSEAGKNGVEAKKDKGFAQAKCQAKQKQNTEYDNEYESDNGIKIKEESKNEILTDPWFDEIFDSLNMEGIRSTFPLHNIPNELAIFKLKARSAPKDYIHRDAGSIRQGFIYQLKNSKATNGHGNNTKGSTRRSDAIVGEKQYKSTWD